tara:strand:- start:1303 stop:2145 length:843 start_codon:yes stop_codon:yes gene_type:complete
MSQDNKHKISWNEIYGRVTALPDDGKFYGVPRGGSIIAGLTGMAVDTIEEADYIVDDLIDSGETKKLHEKWFKKPFVALFDKRHEYQGKWLVFPWEKNGETDIKDTVIRQIEYIGEDLNREGLVGTPRRVIKSWEKLYGGYGDNPKDILSKVFKQPYNEMVILRDIELYSTCEHHLLPFYGRCHIAYLPDKKVIGISKLARLMECYGRRLQIQERLSNQIVDALMKYLKPIGCGCVIEAQHFCMTSRGVQKQNSKMVTSALRGEFLSKEVRAEFFNLIGR